MSKWHYKTHFKNVLVKRKEVLKYYLAYFKEYFKSFNSQVVLRLYLKLIYNYITWKSVDVCLSNVNYVNREAVMYVIEICIDTMKQLALSQFSDQLNASLHSGCKMAPRPGEATANMCSICGIATEKTGRHYGAISCYPCRAFFRRAQVQSTVCKHETVKQC